jgi:hypothetical protein
MFIKGINIFICYMSDLCDKDLTDEEASCYLERYPDLKDFFGDDLRKAKQHWKTNGCTPRESRIFECPSAKCKQPITDKQAHCYLEKYADLKNVYGDDIEKAAQHWKNFGCTSKENRTIECDMKRNSLEYDDDASVKVINTYNKIHDVYNFNKHEIVKENSTITDIEGNLESTQLQLDSSRMKYMGITLGAVILGIVSLKILK